MSDLFRILANIPVLAAAICVVGRLGRVVRRLTCGNQHPAAVSTVRSWSLLAIGGGPPPFAEFALMLGLDDTRRRAGPDNRIAWRHVPTVLHLSYHCAVPPLWRQAAGTASGRWRY